MEHQPTETEHTLAEVVRLLDRAARSTWDAADQDGLRSDLHFVGLGILLAQDTARGLLHDDVDLAPTDAPTDALTDASTAGLLLTQAQQLLAQLPATGDVAVLTVELDELAHDLAALSHSDD